MKLYFSILYQLVKSFFKNPKLFGQVMETVPSICSGIEYSRSFHDSALNATDVNLNLENPLWDYFQNHHKGPGIWKWEHYFEVYNKHLAKFVGKKVDLLEIGIYSGGSLEMWRSYFGRECHIYGVDIEDACKAYANDYVTVSIGDQENRTFWKNFKKNVDGIDILIDDGGHTAEQQQVTLEEMLQHVRPGGVYICEDIHGHFNRFSAYMMGLTNNLNSFNHIPGSLNDCSVTQIQSAIHSIHFYPYLVVIEKHIVPPAKLSAPKHGTEWQPFL